MTAIHPTASKFAFYVTLTSEKKCLNEYYKNLNFTPSRETSTQIYGYFCERVPPSFLHEWKRLGMLFYYANF